MRELGSTWGTRGHLPVESPVPPRALPPRAAHAAEATCTRHLLVLRWSHSELTAPGTRGPPVGELPRSGMRCLRNVKTPTFSMRPSP